jgi:hypothetical protein
LIMLPVETRTSTFKGLRHGFPIPFDVFASKSPFRRAGTEIPRIRVYLVSEFHDFTVCPKDRALGMPPTQSASKNPSTRSRSDLIPGKR